MGAQNELGGIVARKSRENALERKKKGKNEAFANIQTITQHTNNRKKRKIPVKQREFYEK